MKMEIVFGQGATVQPVPVRGRVARTDFGPTWDQIEQHLHSAEVPGLHFGASADISPPENSRRSRQPLHPQVLAGSAPTVDQDILGFVRQLNASVSSRFSPGLTNPSKNQVVALALFSEPPGTALQNFHEDVDGFRLFPVWNATYALSGPSEQNACIATTVAQSLFSLKDFDIQDSSKGSVVFWDGA